MFTVVCVIIRVYITYDGIDFIRYSILYLLLPDIDECYENPKICLNGKCRNTPGSYICECQPGYTVSPDGTFCTDINECEKKPGLCRNGKCANTDGSYKCFCDSGYRLSPDRQNCIGMCDVMSCEVYRPLILITSSIQD